MIWYFIGVYTINRILHGCAEIQDFSSRVEEYFTRSLRSIVKYFSTLEEKFRISALSCNILYLNPLSLALEMISPNREVFCLVYDYGEKEDLCKGYWNLKRKLGVTTHFLEISNNNSKIHDNVCLFFFVAKLKLNYVKNTWLPPVFFRFGFQ